MKPGRGFLLTVAPDVAGNLLYNTASVRIAHLYLGSLSFLIRQTVPGFPSRIIAVVVCAVVSPAIWDTESKPLDKPCPIRGVPLRSFGLCSKQRSIPHHEWSTLRLSGFLLPLSHLFFSGRLSARASDDTSCLSSLRRWSGARTHMKSHLLLLAPADTWFTHPSRTFISTFPTIPYIFVHSKVCFMGE